MTLTYDEINEIEAFIKSIELCADQVLNEYYKEHLYVLCAMARRQVNLEVCQHRWVKDGIILRCEKCNALP